MEKNTRTLDETGNSGIETVFEVIAFRALIKHTVSTGSICGVRTGCQEKERQKPNRCLKVELIVQIRNSRGRLGENKKIREKNYIVSIHNSYKKIDKTEKETNFQM